VAVEEHLAAVPVVLADAADEVAGVPELVPPCISLPLEQLIYVSLELVNSESISHLYMDGK
jgi:hypothetical protein